MLSLIETIKGKSWYSQSVASPFAFLLIGPSATGTILFGLFGPCPLGPKFQLGLKFLPHLFSSHPTIIDRPAVARHWKSLPTARSGSTAPGCSTGKDADAGAWFSLWRTYRCLLSRRRLCWRCFCRCRRRLYFLLRLDYFSFFYYKLWNIDSNQTSCSAMQVILDQA